jgi:hypothetical protein
VTYPDLVTRDKPQTKFPVFYYSKVGLAAVDLKMKTPPLQNKDPTTKRRPYYKTKPQDPKSEDPAYKVKTQQNEDPLP